MPSMTYDCLVNDGKYVVTCSIFIATERSIKTKNGIVCHESSLSRNMFLVQELVLEHKLAAVLSIA